VKLAGVFAEIVADQDVNALVEADPLEELLLPPAHALTNIGKNINMIFLIANPFFSFLLLINLVSNIVKRGLP
jgi:hypothetical protein